jgi:hypothetical protein
MLKQLPYRFDEGGPIPIPMPMPRYQAGLMRKEAHSRQAALAEVLTEALVRLKHAGYKCLET